jgi:hypothetical protein
MVNWLAGQTFCPHEQPLAHVTSTGCEALAEEQAVRRVTTGFVGCHHRHSDRHVAHLGLDHGPIACRPLVMMKMILCRYVDHGHDYDSSFDHVLGFASSYLEFCLHHDLYADYCWTPLSCKVLPA